MWTSSQPKYSPVENLSHIKKKIIFNNPENSGLIKVKENFQSIKWLENLLKTGNAENNI